MVKVRKDQPHGDYSDPGWFEHPEGTVAFEYEGDDLPVPTRQEQVSGQSMPRANKPDEATEVYIVGVEPQNSTNTTQEN